MYLVDVVLPLPLGKFSYALNNQLYHSNLIGCRVIVPLGKTKIYTGVILEVLEDFKNPEIYEIKNVIEVLDEFPILSFKQIQLIQWISNYYLCNLGDSYLVALPSNLKLSIDSFITLLPDVEINWDKLSKNEINIVEYLKDKEIAVSNLEKITGLKNNYNILKKLREKKLIHLYEKIKDKYSPKKEIRIRLNPKYVNSTSIKELLNEFKNKEKQEEILLSYIKLTKIQSQPQNNEKGVLKKVLTDENISESALQTLIKNQIFEKQEKIIDRFSFLDESVIALPQLTEIQLNAKNQILNFFNNFQTVLFQGITGSGKTEIYIHIINEVIESGQQVLLLLPEIALTTQIVKRFRKVFKSFGIYHSRISDNERAELYLNCLNGKFNFIIGVRSAIFLPFSNLSLIIIDEEQDNSYKQHNPAPRYNARDTAIYLAKLHNAKVLLGTATPSLESYLNAKEGKFGWVKLDKRFEDQPLPKLVFIDMFKALKQNNLKGTLTSGTLFHELENCIKENKQALLFLNQRGYASFLQCADCKHITKCPHCDVTLTYHIFFNQIICHYCNFRKNHIPICENCKSENIKEIGLGTEKIEEELKVLFPNVSFQRMDLDTTRSKYSYQKIIDEFENQKTQVLIGTQMISKGLDFENVNLVGVYNADHMIHFPDFRSHEKTLQMLIQISGRAGRKHQQGKVFIQTNDPEQKILQYFKNGNWEDFYEEELKERALFCYPPFFRLLKIIIKNQNKEVSRNATLQLIYQLNKKLPPQINCKMVEPLVSKIRNYYFYEIFVKVKKNETSLSYIKDILLECRDYILALPEFKSTIIFFDIDPM